MTQTSQSRCVGTLSDQGFYPGRRRAGHSACGRCRRASVPADPRPRQTGGVFRRALPHHRLHAEQLHQLRPAPHLHRHAIQVAVAQPPHPDGLEHRLGRAGRIRRDSAAAEARQRALVSGHGRRGVPEPLFDRAGKPAPRHRAVRRSRLQDGLREDAALPQGARRGGDARGHRGAGSGSDRLGVLSVDEHDASPGSSRSRRIRRRFPGRRIFRSARWASTSSTPTCC